MKKIPCVMMRGGTSRGAFLLAEHLPEDQTQRDKILMAIMGSGNDLEIDGIGGGNPLTSKVAIISRSSDPRADVDYLFAQVIVHEQRVDTTPNCGNMLSGVGAFAIENFLNAAGTKTGKVFPTDNQIDYFDDVPVTCIDMAMPVVIIPAEYLGKTGYELPAELDADKALLARIESIRLQAGKAMGLGDVSNMVIPKPVLISSAQKGGAINVRYFMPHSCHRALAITGAIAISSSCALEGTVTRQIVPSVGYGNINIEHPSGALDVHLSNEGQDATTLRASVIRTTRKIFSGEVYLP
ncbi:PrpF domain-containing protein [Escherichia coli]